MSGPFGDPPPGVDLKANHTPRNNATVIALYAIAAVAIALRMTARLRVQNARVMADDWLIVAALVSVTANLDVGGYYGLGKHVWVVELDNVIIVMKILFVYVLIYVVAIPLIKLSIILFYRRIFGMNWAMWVCVFLTIGYFISCNIAFLVCCRPLSYYWTQYREPSGGKCVFDLYPFYIGNAAANVVTDAIILLVPIPLVWRLQMRTTQKVLVSSIFLLGSFVCVASIVRIYFMTFLSKSVDITWIMGDVFIWSSVEPCIGIVCACLPTLQPLLKSALHRIVGSSRLAAKFGGSSSQGVDGKAKRRSQSTAGVGSGHRRLFRSQEGRQRERWFALTPGEEEAILTTSSEPVEMNSVVRGERSDGDAKEDPMSIRVHRDFHYKEEQVERV